MPREIMVAAAVTTTTEQEMLKAVEVLSRAIAGLALEGLHAELALDSVEFEVVDIGDQSSDDKL